MDPSKVWWACISRKGLTLVEYSRMIHTNQVLVSLNMAQSRRCNNDAGLRLPIN